MLRVAEYVVSELVLELGLQFAGGFERPRSEVLEVVEVSLFFDVASLIGIVHPVFYNY